MLKAVRIRMSTSSNTAVNLGLARRLTRTRDRLELPSSSGPNPAGGRCRPSSDRPTCRSARIFLIEAVDVASNGKQRSQQENDENRCDALLFGYTARMAWEFRSALETAGKASEERRGRAASAHAAMISRASPRRQPPLGLTVRMQVRRHTAVVS